jgi:uncharacterized membrane protein YphA (DoxX/SURF4 family)
MKVATMTKAFAISLFCVCAVAAETPTQLFVKDGQLRSHPFAVFVNREITAEMKPTIRLAEFDLGDAPSAAVVDPAKGLGLVAPRQVRSFPVNGETVTFEGTLLMFDLGKYHIPALYTARRVLPIVEWTEPAAGSPAGVRQQVVAQAEIYVGNFFGALFWTAAVVLMVILLIYLWARSKCQAVNEEQKRYEARPALLIITGPDGYLSLWRTQLVLWTLAVGSMVFLYGLLRLQVPAIPDSLVVLMGLSVLTGGVSAGKAARDAHRAGGAAHGGSKAQARAGDGSEHDAEKAKEPDRPGKKVKGRFADLITDYNKAFKAPEISVPKAQMVFWTVIMLILFVVKSWLEGELWAVPWQMVALTGVSQAGYVGDKFKTGTTAETKGASA